MHKDGLFRGTTLILYFHSPHLNMLTNDLRKILFQDLSALPARGHRVFSL